jgi:TolB protein
MKVTPHGSSPGVAGLSTCPPHSASISRYTKLVMAGGLILSAFAGCGGGSSGGNSGSINPSAVVFQSNRDGDQEILSMDSDGRNVRRVTDNEVSDTEPAVSPDGSSIAYVSNRTGNNEIFVVSGAGTRRLTNNAFSDRKPAFSSDGRTLVFTSVRNRIADLYLIDIETLKETRLTATNAVEDDPTFAPDGNIVFASDAAGGYFQIHEIDPRSKSEKSLTSGEVDHLDPSVSPNGARIAFVLESQRQRTISIIPRSQISGAATPPPLGSVLQEGTGSGEPCFGSDGSRLFFSSDRSGNFEIFSMAVDGTDVRKLTNNAATDSSPSVR